MYHPGERISMLDDDKSINLQEPAEATRLIDLSRRLISSLAFGGVSEAKEGGWPPCQPLLTPVRRIALLTEVSRSLQGTIFTDLLPTALDLLLLATVRVSRSRYANLKTGWSWV